MIDCFWQFLIQISVSYPLTSFASTIQIRSRPSKGPFFLVSFHLKKGKSYLFVKVLLDHGSTDGMIEIPIVFESLEGEFSVDVDEFSIPGP